jgi:2-C-methyl-D-erythritol 2,4-cyclodiphosphate synthase
VALITATIPRERIVLAQTPQVFRTKLLKEAFLAHALCDALFGAAGLGDIGRHSPDTDPQWKGANSMMFLEHARKLLDDKCFRIDYVDAVVIMEKPKLGPHFPQMREVLARSLGVSPETIHLTAKPTRVSTPSAAARPSPPM